MRAVLACVAVTVAAAGCGGVDEAERDAAIAAAHAAYAKAKAGGTDFSRGPCIADPLPPPVDDWVADVAHDPRTKVDDDPANQCSAYRSGMAAHFVELDPAGDVVRAE